MAKKKDDNGFYTISKKDVYEELQLIKSEIERLNNKFNEAFTKFDTNFENHLQHHQDIESKNKWFIGLIVAIVSLLVNVIFSLVKGG